MQKALLKKQDHRDTVSQGVVGSSWFLVGVQQAPEAEREAVFRGCFEEFELLSECNQWKVVVVSIFFF